MDSELRKEAAAVIRSLKEENDQLKEDYNRIKVASDLTFKMYKSGNVSAENLESLFDSLLEKTNQELEVFEKAAELHITSEVLRFGKICDRPDLDGLDPITRLLLEEY
jgi:dsDNA-specific endonuclease/ATPase MutS2